MIWLIRTIFQCIVDTCLVKVLVFYVKEKIKKEKKIKRACCPMWPIALLYPIVLYFGHRLREWLSDQRRHSRLVVWVKFFCFVFYGNFSVCLACFSNFLWNIRISDLIWQFSIKTNKSPASENLWLLCCLSLHHDNPPWKILRTVKCKAAEMKVSSKSLEHISWGKHVPRGPLRHRVIRWRLSKHCCSLGWREREMEMEREMPLIPLRFLR